jgi:triosephosphate isomerase
MPLSSRPLVAGNWKMNGLKSSLAEIQAIREAVEGGGAGAAAIVICPPATLVAAAAEICAGSRVAIGGQAAHANVSGAYTGDVSAEMLKDAGAQYLLAGHSERRTECGETDEAVNAKTKAALRAGLIGITCVGETRAEREEGRTLEVLGRQIDHSVPTEDGFERVIVAYEPVWAIGTGLTPTTADIAEAHAFIRHRLEALLPGHGASVRLLYGGSVKPSNAAELMAVDNVDGALVGGASLTCRDFMGIAGVYAAGR